MSDSLADPWRLTPEAFLCFAAALVAGLLIRARSRIAEIPALEFEELTVFDDAGIPLRLAALAGAQPRAIR